MFRINRVIKINKDEIDKMIKIKREEKITKIRIEIHIVTKLSINSLKGYLEGKSCINESKEEEGKSFDRLDIQRIVVRWYLAHRSIDKKKKMQYRSKLYFCVKKERW